MLPASVSNCAREENGYAAMQNAKSANSNGCVAIGYSTLQGDSPGSQNIAIGKYTGQYINSGSSNNILIGANLFSNAVTTSSFAGNIYIGSTVNNTSMASASFNYNVVVGYKAGSVTSGSNNILIGGNNTEDNQLLVNMYNTYSLCKPCPVHIVDLVAASVIKYTINTN